ncbi:MAG: site-specific integrase [Acidobacteria bacterium]|nr:site-specific integrase [Acidobacteriota bacterium]
MRRSNVKLTKREVDALRSEEGRYRVFDRDIPGFGVWVYPSGAKTFFLKALVAGRQVEVKLGRFGADLTVEQARALAIEKRGGIASGEDPAAVRRAWREAPTVKKAATEFLEQEGSKLKPKTLSTYRWDLEKAILPALGTLKIHGLGVEDLRRLHHGMRDTPSKANQCLRVISRLLNWAEEAGYRPLNSNPVKLVKKFYEEPRTLELTDEELEILGLALDEEEANPACGAVPVQMLRLILATGARRGEIVGLRWDELDMARGVIVKSEHKTARKSGKKVIPLNALALDVLKRVPRQLGNPLVFPYDSEESAITALKRAIARVRKTAEAKGMKAHIWIHGLRHLHASVGANAGESLEFVGELLGHKDKRTT